MIVVEPQKLVLKHFTDCIFSYYSLIKGEPAEGSLPHRSKIFFYVKMAVLYQAVNEYSVGLLLAAPHSSLNNWN